MAKRKTHKTHHGVRTFFASLLLVCILTTTICGLAFAWYIHSYVNPSIEDLDLNGLGMNFTSIVYAPQRDENGEADTQYVEYERLHGGENRIWADMSEIPDDLENAFVAIEDQRFYEHKGVDWKRTFGAALGWVGGKGSYGGSTITQQLIKNLTKDDDYSVKRKLTEILRALALEKKVGSKDKILEMYLNMIYMGYGSNGVKTAARTYFDKDLSDLNLAECAALAGVTNNPSLYDPFRFPENVKKRQETILNEMYRQGMITESEKSTALATTLTYQRPADEGANAEPYSYFTDTVVTDVINDLVERKGYSKTLASNLVTSGGLKIYTTVDTRIQGIMEEVYADDSNFPNISKNGIKPESAMVIVNKDGEILGIVGGRGQKTGSLLLNRAETPRQPGSSIKPLAVYGPAMDAGIVTPYTGMEDSPYQQINGSDWPRNDDRVYRGPVVVKDAVAKSINTIAVKTLAELTPEASYEFLTNKLGFKHLVGSQTAPNGKVQTDIALAPLALGGLTNGATVREMAGGYTIFINDGKFIPPHTYTKVLDSEGKVLLSNEDMDPIIAFENVKTSYYMNLTLQGVTSYGTATSAKISGMDTAGKTGTTTSQRDRWFCGYTPYYVGACWFGYDKTYTLSGVSGNPATKLWKAVMTRVHEDLPDASFDKPARDKGFTAVTYCTKTGLLPTDTCETATGYFYKGDEPTERCPGHVVQKTDAEIYQELIGQIDPETGLLPDGTKIQDHLSGDGTLPSIPGTTPGQGTGGDATQGSGTSGDGANTGAGNGTSEGGGTTRPNENGQTGKPNENDTTEKPGDNDHGSQMPGSRDPETDPEG
ncbi:MAG: transglycosylase domain-containing protein [Intestinibacillus sp.]